MSRKNDLFADICNQAGIDKEMRRGYYEWLRDIYHYGHGRQHTRAAKSVPPAPELPLPFVDPFGNAKKSRKQFLAGVPLYRRSYESEGVRYLELTQPGYIEDLCSKFADHLPAKCGRCPIPEG